MRAVLVLAYYFPPCGAVGGLRTLKLCRYLPEAGWRPVVMAGHFPGAGDYAHDPEALRSVQASGSVTRLPGGGRMELAVRLLLSPGWATDTQFSWMRRVLPVARELIAREKPAAILASFTPVADLELAVRLKAEAGLPVVFDFRDAWTANPAQPYRFPWQRAFEGFHERRLLAGADAILAATDPIAEGLRASGARRVETLPNGYDEADFPEPAPSLSADVWRLTFVGSFYADMSLEPVARAMAALVAARPEWKGRLKLRVVGSLPERQREAVARAGFLDGLEDIPPVGHGEAIREMRTSQALLLPLWSGPGTDSIHASKIFSYLRTGRPVLGLVPKGEARKLLESRGHPVLDPEASPDLIRPVLEGWLDRLPATRLPDPGLSRFERGVQARSLAVLMDQVSLRP